MPLGEGGSAELRECLTRRIVCREQEFEAQVPDRDVLTRAEMGNRRQEAELAARRVENEGNHRAARPGRFDRMARAGGFQHGEMAHQDLIARGFHRFKPDAAAHFGQNVGQVRNKAGRVRIVGQDADSVERLDAFSEGREQRSGDRIGIEDVPVPVTDHGRVRRVAGDHVCEHVAERLQGIGTELRRREGSGEASGLKQCVARPQWQHQPVCELHDHFAAGLRPAGFEEGQVTGRDAAFQRQVQLAEPAGRAVMPQGVGEGRTSRQNLRFGRGVSLGHAPPSQPCVRMSITSHVIAALTPRGKVAASNQQESQMTGIWKTWMTIWAWGVVAFGGLLAAGAFPGVDKPAHTLLTLFGSLPDGGAILSDRAMRFSVGLMGVVTMGWGLTIAFLLPVISAAGAKGWRALTLALIIWYVIDGIISIATGFGLNAVSNTAFAIAYFIPLLASAALRAS